jgi:hypothetical protein
MFKRLVARLGDANVFHPNRVRVGWGSRPLELLQRSGEFYRLRAAPVHLRSCASYDQPQAPFRRGAIAHRGEDTWGHRQDHPAHELG